MTENFECRRVKRKYIPETENDTSDCFLQHQQQLRDNLDGAGTVESTKKITSEHLFSEDDCLTKNEVSICDDNTSCSSSNHNQPTEFMQNAQGWCDFDNDEGHKTFEIQKQHTSTYVQTESFEIDEITRLNNLMFCKFISHELDNCIGNDRYEKMQNILEVFKK